MYDGVLSRARCGRLLGAVASLAVVLFAAGCTTEQQWGEPAEEYFGGPGSEVTVSDSVEFTDQPYDDLSGEMTIQEVRDLVPGFDEDRVWYGFDRPYPVEGDCNPEFDAGETEPEVIDELPVEIEGVVTLHPRYFMNVEVCGNRQRFQGTYFIEDETTGIHILKDSRVADVDVGDHVRLRVRGLVRFHSTVGVVAFDNEETLSDRDDPVPIYYEKIDREFEEEEDLYEVRRIRGEVIVEPTSQNFNEMVVQSTDDEDVEWFVSLDRELGTRGVGPQRGDVVELTGPVHDSFGLRMVIATLGQMNFLDQ